MKKKVGLFGFLIHVVIVAAFLMSRNLSGERFDADLVLVAVPLLLVSSFIVYAFIVSRYVERRQGMQKPAVIDSLAGMLSECIIFTLAAALLGIFDWLRGGSGSGEELLTGVLMNLLWVYGTFLVQMLVVGNLCGLVGWFLLRKKQPGR